MTRIYLDNAATSWPKPDCVYDAVDHYQRQVGVAAGRGSYGDAESIARTIQQARKNIGQLIGAEASQIVLTHNCTDALNLALHGLLQSGDHVVTSVAEHNSVLRPLATLAAKGIETTYVPVDEQGLIDLDQLGKSVTASTKLIAITHASNVTGAIQPIEAIGRVAHARDCLLLLDAAQTCGHVPIDLRSGHVDLMAAPGHKGLLGPLGTGILYIASGIEAQLQCIRQGGTGTQSDDPTQPTEVPAKYESGNLNVPGLVGLDAGVRYVLDNQLDQDISIEARSNQLIQGLQALDNLTVYSTPNPCGIVSFNLTGYDPQEVATLLDSAGGIQVRAGLHCAPLMHRSLGTLSTGGTVRASCGHFTTAEEIEQLIELVTSLAESMMT